MLACWGRGSSSTRLLQRLCINAGSIQRGGAASIWQRRGLSSHVDKAEMEIGMRGRLASVVPPRRCTEITHRIGSKFGGSHSLRWITPPRTILLVKKANDSRPLEAARRIIAHIRNQSLDMTVLVEEGVADELGGLDIETVTNDSKKRVDLVITLGGDGTALHVASLFANGAVPPILGISMGNLGFLMPFEMKQFERAFSNLIDSRASLLLRMRLQCSVYDKRGQPVDRFEGLGSQALNEVHLHRGRHPHLTVIETYVDGQHLTEAISDGLIVSTPTGSTAYSLSAGGPIVHPSVPSLLLTPICPRSLSFRSVLLPSDACLQMRISPRSRAPAELSLDGRSVRSLEPGEYLTVSMSKYPVPCIVPGKSEDGTQIAGADASDAEKAGIPESVLCDSLMCQAGGNESDEILDGGWVKDINGMLSFNRAFVTKGLMGHVGDE